MVHSELSGGSSNSSLPKPVNIFYVWYPEQCRRINLPPLNNVKPAKLKSETVLDFTCDRIKPEEWIPILNALRLDTSLHVVAIRSKISCKFLHDMDTEEKMKHMKRRAGSLYTAYILKLLVKSVVSLIKKNDVLSSLELDGVPLFIDNIEALLEALKKNKVIKVLSIKYCNIRDLGCQLLCDALRQMPNIEILNLTACGLGSLSAQYIAKVVKYQQINRYCESWHNSLRYEDPVVGMMAGLKRITLNNNPNICDEGLMFILDELDDDLWIKALDLQRCGITENMAPRLLDVIEYSRSLEIADFRNNEGISMNTSQKILEILKRKQKFGYDNEFKWCFTATTLPTEGSVYTAPSTTSSKHVTLLKSRSVPLKNNNSNTCNKPLRRMKTCSSILNKTEKHKHNKNTTISDAKNEVLALNEELQKEVAKRLQSEEENRKLKEELEKIKTSCNLNDISDVSTLREKVVKFDPIRVKAKPKSNTKPNKVEFIFETKNQPRNILQQLVQQNGTDVKTEMNNYLREYLDNNKQDDDDEDDMNSSGSNSSLIKFMQDVKNDDKRKSTPWHNCYQKVTIR